MGNYATNGAISGKKTVTTAGTAEALASGEIHGPVMIKALAANTGIVYVGNDGGNDVSATTGLELSAGEVMIMEYVKELGEIYVDAATDGEGVTWHLLSVGV